MADRADRDRPEVVRLALVTRPSATRLTLDRRPQQVPERVRSVPEARNRHPRTDWARAVKPWNLIRGLMLAANSRTPWTSSGRSMARRREPASLTTPERGARA
jgi:hypothetical protein